MSEQAPGRAQVIHFLNTVTRPGCRVDGVSDTENLVDLGVMDSLALIQIITWLEEEHDVRLYQLGIDPVELMSIGGILQAIQPRSG